MTRSQAVLLGILGTVVCTCAFGQIIVSVPAKPRSATPALRPDSTFRRLQERLVEGSFDTRAEHVLKAAEWMTRGIFSVPSLQLRKAITYRDPGGDNLMARWQISEPYGAGELAVDDTPWTSLYALKLDACRISSEADLKALVSAVIQRHQPPLELFADIKIELEPEQDGSRRFSGGFTASALPLLHAFDIDGISTDKGCFLSVVVGKGLVALTYPKKPGSPTYPGTGFIPERFPPLSELVRTWSPEQIRAQVGKAVGPGGIVYRDSRDKLLVTELFRRGFNADGFLDLLQDKVLKNHRERAQIVLGAVHRNSQAKLFREQFDSAIQMYESLGPEAEGAVETFFWRAAKTCSNAFEESALKVLRSGTFSVGPLDYLGRCSSSDEALRVVETAAIPARHADKQKAAARLIIERRGR